MVEKVEGWKTEDGRLFEKEEDAKTWEDYINFSQELNTLIETSDIITSYENDKQDIFNFIMQNREDFKKLFDKYGVVTEDV